MTGSADTLYGVDIDAILARPTSQRLARLIDYCRNSSTTSLIIDTYTPGGAEAGETTVHISGSSRRPYQIWPADDDGHVDWSEIDQNSHVTITVRMNAGTVRGRAEDIETLLHELTVHAVAVLPYVQQMRTAHRNAIRGIWRTVWHEGSATNSQHKRLGEGFNRDLSAEMSSMSRHLAREGLSEHLDFSHWMDIANHHEDAPHYQGGV